MTTVRSFWFGEMSPYQRLCMKSFVDYGHRYILYTYDALEVPAGVELQDANQTAPKSNVFMYGPKAGVGHGSVASFSNIFRYRLLQEFGEWWVDADVVCLSEKLPEADVFLGWEDENTIGNAILKFPKGHSLVAQAAQAAEKMGADVGWGDAGPFLMTALAKQHGVLDRVVAPAECYAISSADALQLLLPSFRDEVREKTEALPLLHTWNEVLRRAVVFKWMAPPPGSVMAELFKKHDVSFAGGHAYSADELQRLSDNYTAFTHWSWHRPRIDARESRLAELESERALLKSLYAQAITDIEQARRPDKPEGESVEIAIHQGNGSNSGPAPGPVPFGISVVDYGPQATFAGDPFNLQPNGRSAIWVETSRAPPPYVSLSFDGQKLPTRISGTMLTASVPDILLMRPRTVAIEIKNDVGQRLAQPLMFRVVLKR